ncbi:hypothetical protein [Streptomyces sp. ISL-86]|nr:hypothetical protein [Streptomyces sp. ISL-86]MBT2459194.1 hypothetical protein [Streptomyces sp. ISL-86]
MTKWVAEQLVRRGGRSSGRRPPAQPDHPFSSFAHQFTTRTRNGITI